MRSIVVGVQADTSIDAALDFALGEALRRRLPLVAVHAYQLPSFGDVPLALFPGRIRAAALAADEQVKRAVELARGRIPGGATAQVRIDVCEGDPASVILQFAGSAALVVVGARGGGALVRGLRGSVSAEVLHRALAPVAVVPRAADPPVVPHGPLRIVAAVDGTLPSLAALSWAAAQAAEWGATLVPLVVTSSGGEAPARLRADNGVGPGKIHRRLEDLVRDAGGARLRVQTCVRSGDPVHELLAEVTSSDLLVVGSRGRGPVSSLWAGSTSLSVAEQASCPVVVVRDGQTRREIHQRTQVSQL